MGKSWKERPAKWKHNKDFQKKQQNKWANNSHQNSNNRDVWDSHYEPELPESRDINTGDY
jgi:hypothetical protein